MATAEQDIWKELRRPFDPKLVGKLPRKNKTADGREYLVQLDYVGHAAVTDRLISVDPHWTYEPMASDEHGMPLLDSNGGLWIRLTVGGITRPGYGYAVNNPNSKFDKPRGDLIKEAIGDALRNAAMRFGVALDLWSKQELDQSPEPAHDQAKGPEKPAEPLTEPPGGQVDPPATLSSEQIAELMSAAKLKGHTVKAEAAGFLDGLSALMFDTPFFTHLPADQFEAFKKLVIETGWKR